ncbi:hypothetical protein ACFYNW_32475 [Streptomyces virginiae]
MSDLPFDAVLCDFDGVLRLWDPDGMTALDRELGVPGGHWRPRRSVRAF